MIKAERQKESKSGLGSTKDKVEAKKEDKKKDFSITGLFLFLFLDQKVQEEKKGKD